MVHPKLCGFIMDQEPGWGVCPEDLCAGIVLHIEVLSSCAAGSIDNLHWTCICQLGAAHLQQLCAGIVLHRDYVSSWAAGGIEFLHMTCICQLGAAHLQQLCAGLVLHRCVLSSGKLGHHRKLAGRASVAGLCGHHPT